MISAANSAISSLPTPANSQNNPPASDDSSSFSDVMQQQQQQSSRSATADKAAASTQTGPASTRATSTPAKSESSEATSNNATPSPATTPTAPAPATPAKSSKTPVAAGSDLSAMIIQASVLASNLPQALVAKGVATGASDADSTAPSSKDTPATAADLTTLIAQAASLLAGAKSTTSAKTPAGTATTAPAKSGKDSGTTTTSASDATPTGATDLSTLIVQASILGTGGTAAATTGTNTPVSTTGKAITGASAKEKKSSSSPSEGSFLQSGTGPSTAMAQALSLLGALTGAAGNSFVNQTLTNVAGSKNDAAGALAIGANSLAGTTNDERGKAMNIDLSNTAASLLSSTGASTATTTPDLQIKLSSNTDFTDALKQVVHVANLTQTPESRTPMRVEMEIQTPPGAIVNIYVSKTSDGLRAQLSTNDPAALAWVQNQMSSLKSTSDLGVDVKWAPPQMESGPAFTTTGNQDANLGNPGGGQSNYQQPDERPQQQPQPSADEPELATTGANLFMNSLTSAARAA